MDITWKFSAPAAGHERSLRTLGCTSAAHTCAEQRGRCIWSWVCEIDGGGRGSLCGSVQFQELNVLKLGFGVDSGALCHSLGYRS